MATETASFLERATALMPWMPTPLLEVYAKAWEDSGDPDAAVRAMRQSPLYDQFFAGNKRTDGPLAGSYRFSEEAYMAAQSKYQETIKSYGIDPAIFGDGFVKMITGEQSVDEFASRLDTLNTNLLNGTPEVQAWFMQNYGHAYSTEVYNQAPHVALAMAMDPNVGNQLLTNQITFSQIGGTGKLHGFDISASYAESLAQKGVDQAQAGDVFSAAEQRLPGLQRLADRYNDLDPTFELEEFTDAALGDAAQTARAERLAAAEQSSFSSRQGRVERDQSGGLSGLKQR